MTQAERRVYLINYLLAERNESDDIPQDEYSQKRLLRSLFNVRMPAPISKEFLRVQDEYLQEEAECNDVAARIAVDTVKEFQKQHEIEVIFNVFKDYDYELYRELLSAD